VLTVASGTQCGKTGSRLFTATACKVACRPLVAAQNGDLVMPAQCDVIAQNSRLVFFARLSSSSTVLPNSGFGSSWRQGPLHPGLPNFQSFSAESVEWESTETSTNTESEINGATENSSSSSKVSDLAVVPAPQTSQATIDLRELIVSKERELDVLKASLKQLELAEKLLQKQNIKLDVADESAKLESPSVSGSQLETPWKTPEVKKSDNSLMFGKLSIGDFPTQQDTHYEKLQRRRRRNEMLQQSARNNEVKALNFGASALNPSSTEEKVSDSKAVSIDYSYTSHNSACCVSDMLNLGFVFTSSKRNCILMCVRFGLCTLIEDILFTYKVFYYSSFYEAYAGLQ
jgi:hypothetical protein